MKVLDHLDHPHHYQLGALASLLGVLGATSDFAPHPQQLLWLVTAALVTQGLGCWVYRIPFDPRGALITSLSLTLLFRGGVWWLYPLAAGLAIGSKFLLRTPHGHVFNPANFALVVLLVAFPHQVWISPGVWGREVWLWALVGLAATMVLSRARTAATAGAFLLSFAALSFGRAAYLGDDWAIPWHNLQSGALLIFAFFMITDPKTVPSSSVGRWLFGSGVAVVGFGLTTQGQIREGVFYALFLVTLTRHILLQRGLIHDAMARYVAGFVGLRRF
ncbi:MAG: RnfABCDGE type electron transport complex subunit D [Candidatus Competibacterales bacterium]